MSPAVTQNIRIFSQPLFLIGNLLFTDHIKLITLSVDKNLLNPDDWNCSSSSTQRQKTGFLRQLLK